MKFAVSFLLAGALCVTIGAIPIGRDEGMTADANGDADLPGNLAGIDRLLEDVRSSIQTMAEEDRDGGPFAAAGKVHVVMGKTTELLGAAIALVEATKALAAEVAPA